MERKRVVVAFGDLIGFRNWTRRAITTPEESRAFIHEFYVELREYALRHGVYTKFLGDGIMIVKEIPKGPYPGMAEFLVGVYELATRIQTMIGRHYPRPQGIRFRVSSGHVWKLRMQKFYEGNHVKCSEYVGYVVNLTEHLLHVHPHVLCICHESVVELMGKKPGFIRLQSLDGTAELPRGVDPEDLAGLRAFRIEVPRTSADRRSSSKAKGKRRTA